MSKPIDIKGEKFGQLTVLERVESNKWGQAQWLCECGCEKHTQLIATGKQLRQKYITSCNYCSGNIKNEYDLTGLYGICNISNNKVFYFDLEDYERINTLHWRMDTKGYIVSGGSGNIIYLHRLILNFPKLFVDHINHKTFDNRKQNLRKTSRSENARNRKIQKNNTSGTAGVCWVASRKKWESLITVDGLQIRLGQFTEKKDAIKVRKEAEIKYFGEFRNKEI